MDFILIVVPMQAPFVSPSLQSSIAAQYISCITSSPYHKCTTANLQTLLHHHWLLLHTFWKMDALWIVLLGMDVFFYFLDDLLPCSLNSFGRRTTPEKIYYWFKTPLFWDNDTHYRLPQSLRNTFLIFSRYKYFKHFFLILTGISYNCSLCCWRDIVAPDFVNTTLFFQ